MVKWTGKGKDSPEIERHRRQMSEEAKKHRLYRKHLQAIKDKLDLYGIHALNNEEFKLFMKHLGFFYPGEGTQG